MNEGVFRILGVAFWATVLGAVAVYVHSAWQPSDDVDRVTLVRYLTRPATRLDAADPSGALRINDPVFFQDDHDRWHQIGYVAGRNDDESPARVSLAWYRDSLDPSRCRLVQFCNSGSLEDVVATMLPPEKRRRIQRRLAAAVSVHREELSAAFVPLVQETLRRSIPVIEEEFRSSIASHRGEIDALAGRWNREVVDQKLLPLARQEVIPILRRHGQAPAEKIGRELWDRASLFRFGWRAVYDNTPLPRRDLVREEWERFVAEEAVPVFEMHMDEVVAAVQDILRDIAANDAVRRELGEVAEQLASDPEVRQLVRTIMRETLIDNQRLREVYSRVWQSDRGRAAFDLAGDRLEPVVRQIGDELFGTQQTGIDPDFARVLRNQILGKDRRWIIATPDDQADNVIQVSQESMAYPVVHTVDDGVAQKNSKSAARPLRRSEVFNEPAERFGDNAAERLGNEPAERFGDNAAERFGDEAEPFAGDAAVEDFPSRNTPSRKTP